jgi:UDP-glucose 4-epimerase
MKKNEYVLVTGGAGYIGSHMAGMLIEAGYKVVVFDNLSTGVKAWLPKGAEFVKGDLLRPTDCRDLFKRFRIGAITHFAAKIVVPESVADPILYYRNNTGGTLNLLAAMKEAGVRRIVFSSTAAVYGSPKRVPVTETEPVAPLSPYGASKLMVEQVLGDSAKAGILEFIVLRYFNVAGWDTRRSWPAKGRPVPTHLISNAMKALSTGVKLTVCGTDYKTVDGTGVRDFIHVVDLCGAHLLALKAFDKNIKNQIFNLGTGNGFSVMEVITTAQKLAGRPVPHILGPRRDGDVETVVASSAKARKLLGWKPARGLSAILSDELKRSASSSR